MSISNEKKLYHRLKALSDVFLLSSKTFDYKLVLREATKHFKTFTEADASVLMLNNKDGDLKPVCSLGIPFSKIKDVSLPVSTRLKQILNHSVLDMRYTSFMNIPLILHRRLIGLFAAFSIVPEKFYTFEHDKYENLFLTMLVSHLAVSIDNATLSQLIFSKERSDFDWENTFDAIDDLISVHDSDFNIIRANKAVARKFNMDIREIVGKKCYKIFHNMDEPWKTCPHNKPSGTMTKRLAEIEDPHMGGIFTVTTFPYFNRSGKCVGTIHVTRDTAEYRNMWDQVVQTRTEKNNQPENNDCTGCIQDNK